MQLRSRQTVLAAMCSIDGTWDKCNLEIPTPFLYMSTHLFMLASLESPTRDQLSHVFSKKPKCRDREARVTKATCLVLQRIRMTERHFLGHPRHENETE